VFVDTAAAAAAAAAAAVTNVKQRCTYAAMISATSFSSETQRNRISKHPLPPANATFFFLQLTFFSMFSLEIIASVNFSGLQLDNGSTQS